MRFLTNSGNVLAELCCLLSETLAKMGMAAGRRLATRSGQSAVCPSAPQKQSPWRTPTPAATVSSIWRYSASFPRRSVHSSHVQFFTSFESFLHIFPMRSLAQGSCSAMKLKRQEAASPHQVARNSSHCAGSSVAGHSTAPTMVICSWMLSSERSLAMRSPVACWHSSQVTSAREAPRREANTKSTTFMLSELVTVEDYLLQ